MAQTDGQQPILYVEDGSMSVLPKGAEPARHVSVGETKSKLDLETQGATGEKTGSLGYDSEVAGTGDADFEDAGNVMAALEKQEKAPFPEGGRQAWLTVLGTFCCTMVTFGVLNTYGVYQAYFKKTYLSDYSNFAINWIGTVQYVGIFGLGLPAGVSVSTETPFEYSSSAGLSGKLFDLGFFRPCFLVGAVTLTASQLGLSFANSFATLFVAQGLFMGIGMGIVFNMAIACPSHWFLKRRGMALVCFPIMIQRLIPRIGFGWSMRVLFFIEIVMLTIAWFTIRTRLPPAIDVRDKSKGGWKQVKWIDMHAFKNPAYTMIVIGFGLVVFGLYTPFLGGLIPFAILYGFASGGHVSLQPAVVAQLGPTESVGVRVGNMIAFQALGSVCQPFVGLILGGDPQTGYRWWGACAFSGSMVLAGASCLFVGRRFALGGKWIGKI
ncbi:hypothetical protein QFC20_001180 [Naganishia adeliensis]|uniref:Uncharacterized protein n=1 Tax=Naganishia adeliensis TaxID=92952 RepID=A0ACC2WUL7_9TREE|nr:hypothetical protein QFC20_001180 [Naganishia adeliensis]